MDQKSGSGINIVDPQHSNQHIPGKKGDLTKAFSQTWPAYCKPFRAKSVLLQDIAGIWQRKSERIGSTGKGNSS
jgi:hypothetical protein